MKNLNLKLRNPTRDENFRDRLLIQKITYMSQFLGIDLNYNFGLYKKGPHCPELTDDYYDYHVNDTPSDLNLSKATTLSNDESRILNRIKEIIFSEPIYETHKIDLLQAISTIMFSLKKYSNNLHIIHNSFILL